MSDCWCGETHDPDTADTNEMLRNLGHLLLAAARIPQLADWLTRKLERRPGGRLSLAEETAARIREKGAEWWLRLWTVVDRNQELYDRLREVDGPEDYPNADQEDDSINPEAANQ